MGIRETAQRLARLGAALESVGQYLVKRSLLSFKRESDPDGKPWPPLNPRYAAYKRKKKLRNKINQATGALRDGINYKVIGQTLEVSGNVRYAGFVNRRRRFAGITAKDSQEIKRIIRDYLVD